MRVHDRQDRITVACWDCGSESHLGDNYCSECGSPVRARLLPARAPERRITTRRQAGGVAPALVRGATLLLVGKVLEWAVRRAAGRTLARPASAVVTPARIQAGEPALAAAPALPQGVYRVAALFVQELQVTQPSAPPRRRFLGLI